MKSSKQIQAAKMITVPKKISNQSIKHLSFIVEFKTNAQLNKANQNAKEIQEANQVAEAGLKKVQKEFDNQLDYLHYNPEGEVNIPIKSAKEEINVLLDNVKFARHITEQLEIAPIEHMKREFAKVIFTESIKAVDKNFNTELQKLAEELNAEITLLNKTMEAYGIKRQISVIPLNTTLKDLRKGAENFRKFIQDITPEVGQQILNDYGVMQIIVKPEPTKLAEIEYYGDGILIKGEQVRIPTSEELKNGIENVLKPQVGLNNYRIEQNIVDKKQKKQTFDGIPTYRPDGKLDNPYVKADKPKIKIMQNSGVTTDHDKGSSGGFNSKKMRRKYQQDAMRVI